MRVLFVAPELPQPPFTGAHTRPLSIMRALVAAGHEVVAVGAWQRTDGDGREQPGANADGRDMPGAAADGRDLRDAAADVLNDLCAEVVAVPAAGTRSSARVALSRGRKLLSPVPLIGRGYNLAIGALVAETAQRVQPQALHLQTMYAVHYATPELAPADAMSGKTAVPAVIDLTDVVSGLCESAAQAHPVRYAWARVQAASSRRQEARLLAGMLSMTINDDDRARLARLGIVAYTVPLAIDLPDLRAALLAGTTIEKRSSNFADAGADVPGCNAEGAADESRADVPGCVATGVDHPAAAGRGTAAAAVELLFVGSLLHAPNREAASFLIEKLAPELRRLGLRFRLTLAGRAARPETIGLQPVVDTGIEFHPDVPDLAPLYRRADIVLAPLPHGGGTKNKTLEAMAFSRPVVGTLQAFTGLGADARAAYSETSYDAVAMAIAVAELAVHPLRRVRMARCGREYAAAHHTQEVVNRRVRVLYDAIGHGEGVAAAEAAWRDCASET